MIAVWLEPATLERRSAALALQRLCGRVTYDKLADALSRVFEDYKIHGKVTKVVTDNGSNFVKTFRFVVLCAFNYFNTSLDISTCYLF